MRFILVLTLMLMTSFGCSSKALVTAPYKAPKGTVLKPGSEITFYSARELASKIREGELTSVETVEALLNQIHTFNPKLNAIVTIDEEAVRKRAREADEALAKGEVWGPLHGVPVTIKDQFATKGLRTTNGLSTQAEQITDYDATIVRRFKEAGAIILGKTNMPALAMDFQTFNDVFGRTNNPWDLSRTPGGSTGGGAASVAAGLSPLDFGSDVGGSLRVPAHFCGVYSIKATENLIPGTGIAPGLLSDQMRSMRYMVSYGLTARNIEDLKYCLPIVAGPAPEDVNVPLVDLSETKTPLSSQLRIAWSDNFGGVPISKDTRRVLKEFVTKLEQQGCTVQRIDPEGFDYYESWESWGKIFDLEFGVHTPGFARLLLYTLGKSARKKTPTLRMVFPQSYEKFLKELTRREALITSLDHFFNSWDLFICPVSSTAAIPHHPPESVKMGFPIYKTPVPIDGENVNYWVAQSAYTSPFNLSGNPVVTIPAGFSSEGIPIGLQIVGARWNDMKLLQMSEVINTIAGNYKKPDRY